PGNSPIGLRLPLKSIAFIDDAKTQRKVERSTFEELPTLENFHAKASQRYAKPIPAEELPEEFYDQPHEVVEEEEDDHRTPKKKKEPKKKVETSFEVYTIKTALSIEVREGKIYFFMPPLTYVEHYFDLLASIEA